MSDEVSQFLEQVQRLRGQQIEDDEMRAREREEFLAAKRERQARREERARSISPQKSSPANTPSPNPNRRTVHLSEGLKLDSPGNDNLERFREKSLGPDKATNAVSVTEIEASSDQMAYSLPPLRNSQPQMDQDSRSTEFIASPSKGSPFPWQRRPSRPGSRPLSMVATHNATERSLNDPAAPEPLLPTSPMQIASKDKIAQSLASKDPSWFRQTADRGASSAAYRKNQVEDDDRLDMSSVRAQLPGMSMEASRERSSSRSGPGADFQGKLGAPLALNTAGFDGTAERPLIEPLVPQMTGKSSSMRTGSPTKGMGGFVQSAMMKRSDSVKRWSVANPAGLTRGDSISTNRGAVPPLATRPKSVIDTVPPTTGRPVSRHAELDDTLESLPSEHKSPQTPTRTSPVQPRKVVEEDPAFPLSPSKTTDTRRWSPIKSSWLESALNRPETSPPKPAQPKSSSQPPAWMAELNKPKERPGHRHQVSISGLKTSSPMGTVTTMNPRGLGGIFSPPDVAGPRGTTLNLNLVGDSSSSEREPSKGRSRDHDDGKVERQGSVKQTLAAGKPKPDTPPKKDFRSNLKPRAPEPATAREEEPEFKAVFGTLRRAKTQNFKAPDELKDNILRGKASLNLTEGPQKPTIRDDFKEAILKKKASFARAKLEGTGVVTNAAHHFEQPVPESLMKRAELGKNTPGTANAYLADNARPLDATKRDSFKPVPGPKRVSSPVHMSARQSAPVLAHARSPPRAKAGTELSEISESSTTRASPPSPRNLRTKKSAPSRLGDRFNPALAGLLAKGPPLASNGSREASGASESATEPSAPGPQLTHMTKNRARGPKRRAPTTTPTASAVSLPNFDMYKSTESLVKPKPERPIKSAHSSFIATQDASGEYRFPGNRDAAEKPMSISAQVQQAVQASVRARSGSIEARDSETKRPISTIHRRQPTAPGKIISDFSLPSKFTGDNAQPESPRKLDLRRMSKFLDQKTTTIDAKPELRDMNRLTHTRTGSWSPVKAERSFPEPLQPTPKRHLRSESIQSVKTAAAMFGGAAVRSPIVGPRNSTFLLPQESNIAPGAQKVPPPRPISPKPIITKSVSPKETSPKAAAHPAQVAQEPLAAPLNRSPMKQGGDVSHLLNDFFEAPRQRKPFQVDTAEILSNRFKGSAKIKTLFFHMYQITADGKQIPVSQQNERVLFEQEMYIASHNFTNEAGWKVREVYFWVGDEVYDESARGAEVFAQREAKQVGGKLVRLQQGKETGEFLQALGGVLIVRRRSSIKYDSLAPSMLCGRRYLGQVVFDEVDFDTSSLCSGFSYLIVHSGVCFLWKGKGSDVEELSCARLIGMELSLTGELMEYDEGSEPASFWEVLNRGPKPHSADHWRLKPSYERYNSRLFCSDEDSKQQIYEVAPFNQLDVSPRSIYVLDAFFEVYIIVGARAQSRYASFRNALEFAQEYAIFTASVEDRPFVPISTVVLEGAPRDLKRVFRKWTDQHCPTILNVNGNVAPGAEGAATTTSPQSPGAASRPGSRAGPALKRVRSLRIVPLTQALLALKE
ncbi:Advillin [Escovopsis weberi]|uniref:Advillin n=1 Tax=Escovopsis weberi TaxID=150374 RepID=A0A0M9VTU8_ESCWE|nr:Advillin [Escovopsis weberi]